MYWRDMHFLYVGLFACLQVETEWLFPWFVILSQWKSAWPFKNLCLATEICSKLALEIFDLNYFIF